MPSKRRSSTAKASSRRKPKGKRAAKKPTATRARRKTHPVSPARVEYSRRIDLAAAIGVAPSTLTGLIKRDDWPVRRSPPWSDDQVATVKTWRQWLQEDRSNKAAIDAIDAGDDDVAKNKANRRQQVETALKFERFRRAKVEADEAEARVVDRSIVDRALAGLTAMFVAAIDDLQEALPHQLDGNPATNERKLRDACDDMRRRLASQHHIELARVSDDIEDRRVGKRKARGRRAAGNR